MRTQPALLETLLPDVFGGIRGFPGELCHPNRWRAAVVCHDDDLMATPLGSLGHKLPVMTAV